MHKLIFDVHANYEFIRQDLYLKTDFIDILSKYYRVLSWNWMKETILLSNSKLLLMLILCIPWKLNDQLCD